MRLPKLREILPRLPAQGPHNWTQLSPSLVAVRDPLDNGSTRHFFAPAKDRPVLLHRCRLAEVLLTLDRGDFGALMEPVSTDWIY